MKLIDGDELYKAMKDAEDLARQRVLDTESTLPYPNNLNPSYTRYLAQMDERTKAKHMIADAPTVDAVPVRHGRWVHHPEIGWGSTWLCSECGEKTVETVMGEPRDKFCPMCGADMRKDGDMKIAITEVLADEVYDCTVTVDQMYADVYEVDDEGGQDETSGDGNDHHGFDNRMREN